MAQRHLTGPLGTLGATLVRFLYGLPFAALWLALVLRVGEEPLPAPTRPFFGWVLVGAVCQITATALLLRVMAERNFTLGVAYSKTEIIQVAGFGLAFLGDRVSGGAAAAIALGTVGVLLLSPVDRQRPWRSLWAGWATRSAVLGLLSGTGFGLAAVGFRGAALTLGGVSFLVAAAYTLVVAQALQTLLLGTWLVVQSPAVVPAVLRAWRTSILAGLMGAVASMGWFTAMTIEPAAHVRTLGLVELLFSYLISRRVFRERLTGRELAGVGVLTLALVVMTFWR
jgi:drug/metabolite transporter (DMT)-like permease